MRWISSWSLRSQRRSSCRTLLATHAGKEGLVPFSNVGELLDRTEWGTAELLVVIFVFHALAAARLFQQGLRVEAALVAAHVALDSVLRRMDLSRRFVTVAPVVFVIAWKDHFRGWRHYGPALAFEAVMGSFCAWRSIRQKLCDPTVCRHLVAFPGKS